MKRRKKDTLDVQALQEKIHKLDRRLDLAYDTIEARKAAVSLCCAHEALMVNHDHMASKIGRETPGAYDHIARGDWWERIYLPRAEIIMLIDGQILCYIGMKDWEHMTYHGYAFKMLREDGTLNIGVLALNMCYDGYEISLDPDNDEDWGSGYVMEDRNED
jgi:hypothetical protein